MSLINRYPDGRRYNAERNMKEKKEAPAKNKYGASKTTLDDVKFDSKHEAGHYRILSQMLRAGHIKKLELQVPFVLQEAYVNEAGKKIRAINYKCDFKVTCNNGVILILDSKGFETEVFKIKRKLFEFRYKKKLHCIKKDGDILKIIKESDPNVKM